MRTPYKVHLLCNGKILQTFISYEEAIFDLDSLKYEDSCTGIDDNIYSLLVEGEDFIRASEIRTYENYGCDKWPADHEDAYPYMIDKWNNIVAYIKTNT